MSIAFFDLDRTLLRRNSGVLWLGAELRAGFIRPSQAARAAVWLARYHLGQAGLDAALLEAIATLEGSSEAELRARTLAFYTREVQPLYRPGAHAALARHRAQGHRLVLLTSSSNYLSEPVVEELGLDEALCCRFEVAPDGRFTGRPAGVLAFGEGKLTLARGCAERHGARLGDCTFYTDSASDLPVLEAVGRPVVVQPDPRLRRVARARGWAEEDWG